MSFFTLSKIGWLLVQPLVLILVALLAGLVCSLMGRVRLALALHGVAVGSLAVILFTTLGTVMVAGLESQYRVPDPVPDTIGGIIILGGGFATDISHARATAELNEAGDRYTQALVLARRYGDVPVIVTGGPALLGIAASSDAELAEQLLPALGLAPDRLLLEAQALNTWQNAVNTAQLLREKGLDDGAPWLLVTSAFHMPRAVGCFRQVGLEPVPWPVDYRSTGAERLGLSFANPLYFLNQFSLAVREHLGIVIYRLTGRYRAA